MKKKYVKLSVPYQASKPLFTTSKKERASQFRFMVRRKAYEDQELAQELSAMDQQLSSRGEVDAILQKVLTKLLDPFPSVEELEELEHLAEQALALQNGKPLVLSKDEESIIIHPILPE